MNSIKLFLFILPMLWPISSYGLAGFTEKPAKATGPEIPASAKRPSHVVLVKNKKAECYLPTDNSLMPPWMQALPSGNPLNANKLSFKVPACDNQEVALLKKQAPKMVLRKNSAGSNQVAVLPVIGFGLGAVACGFLMKEGVKIGVDFVREHRNQPKPDPNNKDLGDIIETAGVVAGAVVGGSLTGIMTKAGIASVGEVGATYATIGTVGVASLVIGFVCPVAGVLGGGAFVYLFEK